MTASLTYPPPLSAPPTPATLRGLLEGLQAGAAKVPPSPPLPGGQPGLSPVRAAMETVSIGQWHVEHVATGVPVRLSIGDSLTVEELARLRDELGRPVRVPVPSRPPAAEAEAAADAAPALGFAARPARRAAWAAGVGAASVALAAAILRLAGLDLPLP